MIKQAVGETHLSLLTSIPLGAVASKKTRDCFPGEQRLRGFLITGFLPEEQPAADACTVSTYRLPYHWTLTGVLLKLPGIKSVNNTTELGNELVKQGYVFESLAQAESLALATISGIDTGMQVHGGNNFFLYATGHEQVPVLVGDIFRARHADNWRFDTDFLRRINGRSADDRILIRNLEASLLMS